jgi:hypothetical protein
MGMLDEHSVRAVVRRDGAAFAALSRRDDLDQPTFDASWRELGCRSRPRDLMSMSATAAVAGCCRPDDHAVHGPTT